MSIYENLLRSATFGHTSFIKELHVGRSSIFAGNRETYALQPVSAFNGYPSSCVWLLLHDILSTVFMLLHSHIVLKTSSTFGSQ